MGYRVLLIGMWHICSVLLHEEYSAYESRSTWVTNSVYTSSWPMYFVTRFESLVCWNWVGIRHGRCIYVTFRVHRVRDSFGRCICATFRVHWADMSHEVHESRTLCTWYVTHMQRLQRWQRVAGLRDWAWNSACMSHELYESRTICIRNVTRVQHLQRWKRVAGWRDLCWN